MALNIRTAAHHLQRHSGLGTALSSEAVKEIMRWINELRRDGVLVSSAVLKARAIEVAATSGIDAGLFAASNPWKGSFLRRHRMSFWAKNRPGQASPDEDNALGRAFALEVREWMKDHGVTKVYNADQTAVFFEMLPK